MAPALRYAREVLKINTVPIHHNSKNLPMIAIDRRFGYVQVWGAVSAAKSLEERFAVVTPGMYIAEQRPGCV